MNSSSTTNLHIRGIPQPLIQKLKSQAKRQNTSINSCALHLLAKGLGLETGLSATKFHELDHLAGTWTKQDENEFLKNTNDFNKIDKELW